MLHGSQPREFDAPSTTRLIVRATRDGLSKAVSLLRELRDSLADEVVCCSELGFWTTSSKSSACSVSPCSALQELSSQPWTVPR